MSLQLIQTTYLATKLVFDIVQILLVNTGSRRDVKRQSRVFGLEVEEGLIRPVVTYAAETWVLKENEINQLTFERNITRKIYGCTRTADGHWRIKTNQEMNDILSV